MAVPDDTPPSKDSLRARLRARRDALPAAARAAWSEHLAEFGAPALRERLGPAAIVAAYWPLRSEADPRPLARALQAAGASLALPVVAGEAMCFRAWSGGERDLEPAGFGALGPGASAPVVLPTLVLVPLLGFDATGQRLGWGKGYYDRFLAGATGTGTARPLAVGIAFACQRVGVIPSEPHDVRLDGVLTEQGLLVPVPAADAPKAEDCYPCGTPRRRRS